jgi:SAM-dependent methyltransferase
MKFVTHPARGVSFFLITIRAAIVLLAVVILWLALFTLSLPFLLLSEVLGWRKKHSRKTSDAGSIECGGAVSNDGEANSELIFDRRADVSKLFGCNTRNVEYRWDLFTNRLEDIKRKTDAPRALDFGAGSLRDSYELVRQGFDVTSMDLDPKVMQRYFDSYDWSSAGTSPQVFTDSIDRLGELVSRDYFHLAISFDVIEHLEQPEQYLRGLRPLLRDDGYLFAIVPNRRSIFERYFKHSLKKQRQRGLKWTPGVPHLQFRSPQEWDQFIQANGFEVVEHDMAIGPLVNDVWQGMLGLPIRVYVAPGLHRLANILHLSFNPGRFEEGFFPAWLMRTADVLDSLLKRHTRNRFGWNLIVARRKPIAASGN